MNIIHKKIFFQKMNIIKFLRLLFYHIYVYYDKTEKENKTITKFSTFLVFTVIFSLLAFGIYNLGYQNIDEKYTGLTGKSYIVMWLTIGTIVAYYLYKEDFNDLDTFRGYNKKYYFYFFLITIFAFFLAIFSAQINRKRILIQTEVRKEHLKHIKMDSLKTK